MRLQKRKEMKQYIAALFASLNHDNVRRYQLAPNPELTGERMNEVNEASPAGVTGDVERVVMRDCWNKCDVCGRFIATDDFNNGAVRVIVDPLAEVYETLCIQHKDA